MQYFGQKIVVTSQQQITKSSTKDVNLGTITDTESWSKIQPLNGFNLTRAKRSHLGKRKGVYGSFSYLSDKPKVVYTDNSLEVGKSCEDLTWNHRT